MDFLRNFFARPNLGHWNSSFYDLGQAFQRCVVPDIGFPCLQLFNIHGNSRSLAKDLCLGTKRIFRG